MRNSRFISIYKKILFLVVLCILIQSCYFRPKYTLSKSPFKDTFVLDPNKKYLLIKNNLHTNNIEFRKKIDNDFKRIIGSNLHFEYSIIDFDNNRPILITPYLKDLLHDAYSSEYDYVLFLTFIRNPEGENDIKDKIISIKKVAEIEKRNYTILLRIVDLKEKKILYSKEAISSYTRYLSTGFTTSPLEQIERTFNILLKDFEKKEIKNKN